MCSYGGRTLYFWLSFFAMGGGILLALVSVCYDQITKVTGCELVIFGTGDFYCGWQEFHNSTLYINEQSSKNDLTWTYACNETTKLHGDTTYICTQEKIGKAWISLMFIGIFFGLVSATGYIVDVFCCTSHTWALGTGTLFTVFVTLAMIVWAADNKCIGVAKHNDLLSNCHAQLGTSWYLALGAALLGAFAHSTYNYWK